MTIEVKQNVEFIVRHKAVHIFAWGPRCHVYKMVSAYTAYSLERLSYWFPTPLWSSSRIRPWSSTLHLIHHSSQYGHN